MSKITYKDLKNVYIKLKKEDKKNRDLLAKYEQFFRNVSEAYNLIKGNGSNPPSLGNVVIATEKIKLSSNNAGFILTSDCTK